MTDSEMIDRFVEVYYKEVLDKFFLMPPGVTTIYHYTTAEALISILEGSTLYATNVKFMNDTTELEYPISLLRKTIDETVHDPNPGVNQAIKDYYNQTIVPRMIEVAERQFILSFSFDKDSLHLWNYYSRDDGYAIGFDLPGLHAALHGKFLQLHDGKGFNYETFSIHNGIVIYEKEAQEEFFKLTVRKMNILLKLFVSNPKGDINAKLSERIMDVVYVLRSAIYNMKFEPNYIEKEFRFVVIPDKGFPGPSFRNRAGLIVPFVKIGGSSLPIRQIIIGPKVRDQMAKNGIDAILRRQNLTDVSVQVSSISIR